MCKRESVHNVGIAEFDTRAPNKILRKCNTEIEFRGMLVNKDIPLHLAYCRYQTYLYLEGTVFMVHAPVSILPFHVHKMCKNNMMRLK